MLPLRQFSISFFYAFVSHLCVYAYASSGGDQGIAEPTITLDTATFIGSSEGDINRYLGIPYAEPPVGKLRFSRPVPAAAYTGTYNASNFGPMCPQQHIDIPKTFPPTVDLGVTIDILNLIHVSTASQSEDCLSLNVWTPSNAQPGSDLPVAIWIHGGGFQIGGSALYDGKVIAERARQLGEPIVVVSINYRLSGKFKTDVATLGWLVGKEAQDAGVANIGYRDQRLALQWIQKHIHSFGGDPSKVVIWGQSAGSISVAAQMQANGGNPGGLFRGSFMQSGSFLPLGDMQGVQRYYDNLVADAGCTGAYDTLDCLRYIPFKKLKAAIDASPVFLSYQTLALSWGPRIDDDFFPDPWREPAAEKTVADVPVVIGTCDDEGTLFALSTLNVSTSNDLLQYLSTFIFPNASLEAIDQLAKVYPEDLTLGSPFNTGTLNAVTPQFKRMAALFGDYIFEAPRRTFLQATSGTQDVWTYISKRQKNVAVLGSAHLTDVRYSMFDPSDMTDHLIHFVNHLDPNGLPSVRVSFDVRQSQEPLGLDADVVTWPKYDAASKAVLTYLDGQISSRVVYGIERDEQVRFTQDFQRANRTP